MASFDFDRKVQEVFSTTYADIPATNWRKWLTISSGEEYESTALTLSGLSGIDDLFDRIKTEKTDPKSFSVNVKSFLESYNGVHPPVLCHTSGTSGGSISDVKWFHMPEPLVKKLWAPGMQAIFEASGLNSRSSAVIFVPSRAGTDGLSVVDGKPVIRLYSAEFSQRLVISIINPRSYLLYEYKDAYNLQVLAQILSMDNIAVVSAPSATVLGWANLNRLRKGLEKSLDTLSDTPEICELKKKIKRMGIDAASVDIQNQLSAILSDTTLIFSTTGITDKEWGILRKFLQWKKGEEKYTNLYVGSEGGPFAASIGPVSDSMYVFPLTLPVVGCKGNYDLISRCDCKVGRLFISYMHNVNPIINIDTGDVITIENQKGLPVIQGEILRAGFPLRREVTLSPEVGTEKSRIWVGSYFNLEGLEIRNPRQLVTCLAEQLTLGDHASVVVKKSTDGWTLVIPFQEKTYSPAEIEDTLSLCPGGKPLEHALQKKQLHLEVAHENLVESKMPRSELLKRVRRGELPKGVLMRWPLYVVLPPEWDST